MGPGSGPRVSGDGSVIVANDATGPFRWTEATGRVDLGDAPGNQVSEPQVLGVSADGAVVVGRVDFDLPTDTYAQAFRWTQNEGVTLLFSSPVEHDSVARGASADGSVIVGAGWFASEDYTAFIWDAAQGPRSIRKLLTDTYGLDLHDWVLNSAEDVSADGRVIVGLGSHNGVTEGWIAVIPEPSTITLAVTALLGPLALAWRRRGS